MGVYLKLNDCIISNDSEKSYTQCNIRQCIVRLARLISFLLVPRRNDIF